MALVASGRVNKQIAADMGISEVTARVHRGQVMRKMQASSLPDLARMADKLKLTPGRVHRPDNQSIGFTASALWALSRVPADGSIAV